jgi:hypothetical protein
VLPLVLRVRHSKAPSDASSLAVPMSMVDIQGLSMSTVGCILEEAILEALQCELLEIIAINVDIVRSDEVCSTGLFVGPEASLPVPQGVTALVSHTAYPVLILEGTASPEGALALKGAIAPMVAAVGSSPVASMEVQVGSPMPQIDDVVAMSSILAIGYDPDGPTTLEVSGSNASKVLPSPMVEEAT